MKKDAMRLGATAEVAALLSYQVYSELCVAKNVEKPERWIRLPKDARDAYVGAALFAIQEPEKGTERCHVHFVGCLKAKEWQYGETVDVKYRRHPLVVPFDRLTLDQRVFYKVLAVVGKSVDENNLLVVNGDAASEIAKLSAWLREREEAVRVIGAERDAFEAELEDLQMLKAGLEAQLAALGEENKRLEGLLLKPPSGSNDEVKIGEGKGIGIPFPEGQAGADEGDKSVARTGDEGKKKK